MKKYLVFYVCFLSSMMGLSAQHLQYKIEGTFTYQGERIISNPTVAKLKVYDSWYGMRIYVYEIKSPQNNVEKTACTYAQNLVRNTLGTAYTIQNRFEKMAYPLKNIKGVSCCIKEGKRGYLSAVSATYIYKQGGLLFLAVLNNDEYYLRNILTFKSILYRVRF